MCRNHSDAVDDRTPSQNSTAVISGLLVGTTPRRNIGRVKTNGGSLAMRIRCGAVS